MNAIIELHDSKVSSVVCIDGSAALYLFPAFIHRSEGRPGIDAGSVWIQTASLTFAAASVSLPNQLPAQISDGSLRIGNMLYENAIPAGGAFDAPIELRLTLTTSETLTIRGEGLTVALQGEPSCLEEFSP